MYSAGHLLQPIAGTYIDGRLVTLTDTPIEVDVIERLPTPWGLVRGGVAPDHPEKKLVARVFESIAPPGFRMFGNVEVGRDLQHDELAEWYDAVIYAMGARNDRHLGIPGEELPGCWAASAFVGWYNGHPDFSDLDIDLSCERAVIVGNGNVALDVARILALPVDELAQTDIADYALDALRASTIREVVIIGRRSHLHAAFNNPELEEAANMADIELVVELEDGSALHQVDQVDWATRRKLETLRRHAGHNGGRCRKRIVLRFLTSPVEVLGDDRVQGIQVARNELERTAGGALQARPTTEQSIIQAGLVIRAMGYFGSPVPGLPFDERLGVIPNQDGRVVDSAGVIPRTYVAGWAKRGPNGVIGTNKKCARDTVRSLLNDASTGRLTTHALGAEVVANALRRRKRDITHYEDWRAIDRYERHTVAPIRRPRVKLTSIDRMLEVANRGKASL